MDPATFAIDTSGIVTVLGVGATAIGAVFLVLFGVRAAIKAYSLAKAGLKG